MSQTFRVTAVPAPFCYGCIDAFRIVLAQRDDMWWVSYTGTIPVKDLPNILETGGIGYATLAYWWHEQV